MKENKKSIGTISFKNSLTIWVSTTIKKLKKSNFHEHFKKKYGELIWKLTLHRFKNGKKIKSFRCRSFLWKSWKINIKQKWPVTTQYYIGRLFFKSKKIRYYMRGMSVRLSGTFCGAVTAHIMANNDLLTFLNKCSWLVIKREL